MHDGVGRLTRWERRGALGGEDCHAGRQNLLTRNQEREKVEGRGCGCDRFKTLTANGYVIGELTMELRVQKSGYGNGDGVREE